MRRILFALLWVLTVSTLAAAEAPHPCGNPRLAVESVFLWQQAGHTDLTKASRCLESAGRSVAERRELARRIQVLFHSNGWRVDVAEISDDPEYRDPETRRSRVRPHPAATGIAVARDDDGTWRWTRDSLTEVSTRYAESIGPLDDVIRRLPPSFRDPVFGVQIWQYLALFALVLIGLVVRKIIAFIVTTRVKSLAERLGQAWASRIVDVFASPGATLIMAGILRFTYPQLQLPIKAALITAVAVRVLVVLSVVWAVYRCVDVLAARMARRAEETDSKLDDQLVPLVRKALKILVVVAGGLFILQNLDVDVGSLLAGLGIGGIAFALAAKDTLANFFGSVMIFLDRPFQIGDWIRIGDTEGIVEEVGFRSTRIRTFYNSVVTVPNAKFTESHIDNLGEREYRRCFVTLNLTYDTTAEQMQAFVEGVRAVIAANPSTRKDYYEVHLAGFGAHSLDVMVYFFFKVDSWTAELTERHNVFLEILRLAEELGVSFAFPTQTLHVDSLGQPGEPRKVPEVLPPPKLAEVVSAYGPAGRRSRPGGPRITHGYLAGARRGGEDAEG